VIIYTGSSDDVDLLQIIDLQQQNLAVNLSSANISSQGFVTVCHSLEQLRKMNAIEQHRIAKENGRVIAYLLAMTAASKEDIPILFPMFEIFKRIIYKEKPVTAYKYIVVGQVCVDKNYRGQGVLDHCYADYRLQFKERYDFAITEIAITNQRSMRAHERIGFKEVRRYHDADQQEWSIVIWEW
jgi:predicted GNAT superfamily acetyltransferase